MAESITDNLCWKIVTEIAEKRNVEPHTIEERVGDVVDIEALQRLARQSGGTNSVEVSVSFRIAGCFVTVTDGGRVRVSCPGTNDVARSNRCVN